MNFLLNIPCFSGQSLNGDCAEPPPPKRPTLNHRNIGVFLKIALWLVGYETQLMPPFRFTILVRMLIISLAAVTQRGCGSARGIVLAR